MTIVALPAAPRRARFPKAAKTAERKRRLSRPATCLARPSPAEQAEGRLGLPSVCADESDQGALLPGGSGPEADLEDAFLARFEGEGNAFRPGSREEELRVGAAQEAGHGRRSWPAGVAQPDGAERTFVAERDRAEVAVGRFHGQEARVRGSFRFHRHDAGVAARRLADVVGG